MQAACNHSQKKKLEKKSLKKISSALKKGFKFKKWSKDT